MVLIFSDNRLAVHRKQEAGNISLALEKVSW
jgi:hypothetical protein